MRIGYFYTNLMSLYKFRNLGNWDYTRCDKWIENSIFDLTSLNLTPEPELGGSSTLHLAGILKDGISDLTEIDLTVQFGRMVVYKRTLNFCSDLDEYLPEKCPIKAGVKNWTYSFSLPDNVPKGSYTIKLDINQKGNYKLFDIIDERQLICLIFKVTL